jgi:DNA polymerase-3 subunit epsilon
MQNFIAIDFETANQHLSSICQAAAVRVENGQITECKEWYIQPKDLLFSPYNTYKHGISANDVKNAPEFCDIWNELKEMLAGNVVVAFNVSFDMHALRNVLQLYQLDLPEFKYYCAEACSKRVMSVEKYSLINICKQLDIKVENSHNAKYDAIACAEVAIKLGIDEHYYKVFPDDLGRDHKESDFEIWWKPLRLADLTGIKIYDLSETIKADTFKGKSIVVTGQFNKITRTQAEMYVSKMGAILSGSICNSTSLVVMGDIPGPAKIDKIKEFNMRKFLPVIDETEFLETLEVLDLL